MTTPMTTSPLHILISQDGWHALSTGTSGNPAAEEYLTKMFTEALKIGIPVHLTDENGKKVGQLQLENDAIRGLIGF